MNRHTLLGRAAAAIAGLFGARTVLGDESADARTEVNLERFIEATRDTPLATSPEEIINECLRLAYIHRRLTAKPEPPRRRWSSKRRAAWRAGQERRKAAREVLATPAQRWEAQADATRAYLDSLDRRA